MKASIFQKTWILTQTIASTLGISVLALYLRFRKTYDRSFADRVLRWWSGLLLRSVKATFELSNPHNVTIEPGRPHIIMSNHRSHYDIPLIFLSLPGSIRMLTKKELFSIPIWGRGLKAAEFLSIDRKDHDQALKDMEHARERMQSGIVLWIAPEGTRTRSGALGSFKKGGFVVALQTGAVIIPVGIRDSEQIHRPDTRDLYLNRHVHIAVGEPLDASRYTMEMRDQLMDDVKKSIMSLI